MDNKKANAITLVLSAVGVLLILAGAFDIIAMKYGLFLGAAAFIVGGVLKKV